jgi:ubiquinone/menaquinone biosynthesis C-methylase UbiE
MARLDLDDTGERMIPDEHQGLIGYAEHIQRYQAVGELARGKTVLDIACGSGYGSRLLADAAARVIGVDVSPEAIDYARSKFANPKVEFVVGSATAIPLDDDSVDLVVTYETIEHIDDYRAFMAEIRRVLKPGGLAIVSTPNDLEYEEGNHFHLHEFERDELLALVGDYFEYVDDYYQATWKYVALDRMSGMDAAQTERPTVNLARLSPEQMRYFFFLCSDRPITEVIAPTGALGEHYSEREVMGWHQRIAALEDEVRQLRTPLWKRVARRVKRVIRPPRG